jgi:hypothetical protein
VEKREEYLRKIAALVKDEVSQSKRIMSLKGSIVALNNSHPLVSKRLKNTMCEVITTVWNRSASHSTIFSASVRSLTSHLDKAVLNVHFSYFLPSLILLFSLCVSNRCIHLYNLALQKAAKRRQEFTSVS